MQSRIIIASAFVTALVACSDTPGTMLSPTGVPPASSALNPDGSNLKVDPPANLQPTGDVILDTNQPTLTWTPSAARHDIQAPLDYHLQIVDATDRVVYERFPAGAGAHAVENNLSYSDNFWWRVRARIGEDVGPWSDWAPFRTPDPPTPTAGPSGELPFPIPAECGPFGPGNRIACVLAVAAQSQEWGRCRSGSGLGCHRFVRQVFYALNQSDPNWAMIQAAPGGHACHCGGCGGSDGTMFREDTMFYPGLGVVDLVTGAGGPSPGLSWSRVPGPRSSDTPADAPLCTP